MDLLYNGLDKPIRRNRAFAFEQLEVHNVSPIAVGRTAKTIL